MPSFISFDVPDGSHFYGMSVMIETEEAWREILARFPDVTVSRVDNSEWVKVPARMALVTGSADVPSYAEVTFHNVVGKV